VPKALARPVHELYFNPQHEEFQSRTLWSLSNAFTSAFKELEPISSVPGHRQTGGVSGGGVVAMHRCPECGSISLEVVVEVWATLIQNAEGFETDATTSKNGSHEWGDNSVMRCLDCDCLEISERFKVASQEAG
jgi:hypothetical protein